MKTFNRHCMALVGALSCISLAGAQWTPLTNQPNFQSGAGTALLLTDGSVLVHNESALLGHPPGPDWMRLRPDSKGDYVNGTWSSGGSMQSTYGPLYFASAVMADGRVVVFGGEYNLNQGQIDTNQGAIYDPPTNSWSPLAGPGWNHIGDAVSTVLPDGSFLLGNFVDVTTATLDPLTLLWTVNGQNGKTDKFSEEGWNLLPDGTMLTVDCWNGQHAEKYVISTGQWISAGDTPDPLCNGFAEMGPAVLRPDGTVIAFGATGHNDIYTPPAIPTDPGSWTHGPDFPMLNNVPLDCADSPACLLPSGNVLVVASPGTYKAPSRFFEFDGANLISVPMTPNSPNISSFQARMLLLPTGQVLVTDGTNDVEIYTPSGGPAPDWRPTLVSPPQVLQPGSTVTLTGRQFNGLSQAVGYGDDSQAATNYPLVRITNDSTGDVQYCRTHHHSSMGVATKTGIVSTEVDIPFGIAYGPSHLEVVANGIGSIPQAVTVANDIISGTVNLQSYSKSPAGLYVFVQIRQAGTLNTLDAGYATLDATGKFVFPSNLADGTYDVTVKASHWLRRKVANVTIFRGYALGLSFSLLNGDVNGDNVVSLADFGLLKTAFGSSTGGQNYNPNADLNGDGVVSLADFGILKSNFGASGDP